eukprot:123463-Rhodomonas_salina.3
MDSPFCFASPDGNKCEDEPRVVSCNGQTFLFTPTMNFTFTPSLKQLAQEVKSFPHMLVQVDEIEEMMAKEENKNISVFILSDPKRFALSEYRHLLQKYIQQEYGFSKVVDIRAVDVWIDAICREKK